MQLSRSSAAAFGALLLGAVLLPAIQNFRAKPIDGFPLSHYPMFSKNRRGQYACTHLLGLTADGRRRAIHHRLIASGGFNQVRRQVRKLVKQGRAETLLARVRDRLEKDASRLPDVVELRVVTGRYRFDDYFKGETASFAHKRPFQEKVHAKVMIRAAVSASKTPSGKRG